MMEKKSSIDTTAQQHKLLKYEESWNHLNHNGAIVIVCEPTQKSSGTNRGCSMHAPMCESYLEVLVEDNESTTEGHVS